MGHPFAKSRRGITSGPRNISNEAELDTLNERLMNEINRRGKIYFSHTKLNDRLTLRLAIGNIRTTREYVKLAWDELNEVLAGMEARGSKIEDRG